MVKKSNPTLASDEVLALAEGLRQVIGNFVRMTRSQARTPSTAYSETLGILDRDGAMSTAALAEQRNVKHQSMRLVVAQLEEDGLVRRTTAPHDRRSQLVTVTSKGRSRLIEDRHRRARMIAAVLGDQTTPEERHALGTAVAILGRIAL